MMMGVEVHQSLFLCRCQRLSFQWGAPHRRPHPQETATNIPGVCRTLVGCPSHWEDKQPKWLTATRNCAMIIDVEGYTRIAPSGAKLPIRVCYSVTLDKLPNGTGGEFCFSGLDRLASVGSTTPVLTQQRAGGA